jgi:acetate kinase
MKVLVVNCGSSSIKYKLYDMTARQELASGLVERVGTPDSKITHRASGKKEERSQEVADYDQSAALIIELLKTVGDPPPIASADEIVGVGHRVVHGGEAFSESVLVDERVLAGIEQVSALAPLHNPANLGGIRAAMKALSGKPQVAVFDTAFFQTMPPAAFRYAVPTKWYSEHQVRRYGFHGTSHRYVTAQAAQLLNKPQPNLITLHLGNGCSAACIANGQAVDQSMGLTPLEGLVMGTRSGDIDPAIVFHMVGQGLALDDVRKQLEKQSGLLGLSERSNDMRDIWSAAEAQDANAALALDVFAHRARKYIGAFLSELPDGCDAVVFTGGIGENDAAMRAKILDGLTPLGIRLDPQRNEQRSPEAFRVTTDDSVVAGWVIPTDEELMIAQDTQALIQSG